MVGEASGLGLGFHDYYSSIIPGSERPRSWAWWLMPKHVLLPVLRRLRWEDLWFEASLGCQMYPGIAWVLDRMRPCFKNSPPKKIKIKEKEKEEEEEGENLGEE